jgi:hypothetical protein
VRAVEPLGRETLVHVQVGTHVLLVVSDSRQWTPGSVVWLLPELEQLQVFPPEEEEPP